MNKKNELKPTSSFAMYFSCIMLLIFFGTRLGPHDTTPATGIDVRHGGTSIVDRSAPCEILNNLFVLAAPCN